MATAAESNEIRKAVKDLLEVCHARGIELPWLIAAVAINASIFALRVTTIGEDKSIEVETLIEKRVDEKMILPIHFMIVDGKGGAHHASITKGAVTFH
jgi:hypothetical protein